MDRAESTVQVMDMNGPRVDALEREYQQLKVGFTSVAAEQAAQRELIETQNKQLTDISAKLDDTRTKKTDWSLIATWVGVLVVIWGLTLAPLYRETLENESSILKVEERLDTINASRYTSAEAKGDKERIYDFILDQDRELARRIERLEDNRFKE